MQSDKKRLAKNTAFLYLRMLLVMAISFFTVRLVLHTLGKIDYGVFNVVGGLSLSFIFFQSALTNATQRFLNFGLGQNDQRRLGQIFNLSLEIFLGISAAVLVIGGIVGTWLVLRVLNIPEGQTGAACVVLFMTLLSLVFTLIASVYEAVLVAHENMKIYAWVGLFDALAKLAAAYAIVAVAAESRLAVYAILLTFFTMLPKLVMVIYCRRKYSETAIKPYWDRHLFRELFAFSGWNIYGTGVWMLNQQGINILLNVYFGPAVNTAQALAAQVTNTIKNFSNSFSTAVKPQIIKSYAAGEMDEYRGLIYFSSRMTVYLLWALVLPAWLRIDYVLGIWLTEVPPYTASFVRWVLVFMLVDSLNTPLWTAIQAVGKLRRTILYGSTFFMLAFPLSWIALAMGGAPVDVYPILIGVRIIYLVIVFRILSGYVHLSASHYLASVIGRILLVMVPTFLALCWANYWFPQNFLGLIAVCILSTLLIAAFVFSLGLTADERRSLIKKVKKCLSKES